MCACVFVPQENVCFHALYFNILMQQRVTVGRGHTAVMYWHILCVCFVMFLCFSLRKCVFLIYLPSSRVKAVYESLAVIYYVGLMMEIRTAFCTAFHSSELLSNSSYRCTIRCAIKKSREIENAVLFFLNWLVVAAFSLYFLPKMM